MNQKQIETLQNYCYLNQDEWCGVLLKSGTVRPMKNVSKTPHSAWEFEPNEWLEVASDTDALIHSHVINGVVDIRTPSIADIKCHYDFELPLYICGMNGIFYEPIRVPSLPSQKYDGRKYIAGVNDCSTLLRDFYLFEFGVNIKLDLMKSICKPKEQAKNIKWGLELNGFVEGNYDSFEKGDVMLINGTHGVIVVDNEWVINQGSVSVYEPLQVNHVVGGIWRLQR